MLSESATLLFKLLLSLPDLAIVHQDFWHLSSKARAGYCGLGGRMDVDPKSCAQRSSRSNAPGRLSRGCDRMNPQVKTDETVEPSLAWLTHSQMQ